MAYPKRKYIDDERSIWTKLQHGFWNHFRPETLEYYLKAHPEIRMDLPVLDKRINLSGLMPWERFSTEASRRTKLIKPPQQGSHSTNPSVSHAEIPNLKNLIVRKEDQLFRCDIKDVEGLGASKSRLSDYKSISEFAQDRCASYLEPCTVEQFDKMLSHGEIRIIHSPGSDNFYRQEWDGRIFLSNSGGSHHFAAAQHIAKELGIDYTLAGTLIRECIDYSVLSQIGNCFSVFIVSNDALLILRTAIAVEFKCSYLEVPLPLPLTEEFSDRNACKPAAIFLPKNCTRTRKVIDAFEKYNFVDLWAVLRSMHRKQVALTK